MQRCFSWFRAGAPARYRLPLYKFRASACPELRQKCFSIMEKHSCEILGQALTPSCCMFSSYRAAARYDQDMQQLEASHGLEFLQKYFSMKKKYLGKSSEILLPAAQCMFNSYRPAARYELNRQQLEGSNDPEILQKCCSMIEKHFCKKTGTSLPRAQ
jgi:hypothetical protein